VSYAAPALLRADHQVDGLVCSSTEQTDWLIRHAHRHDSERVPAATRSQWPLLPRLGVDEEHEGRGLGAALLGDVIVRTAAIGDEIGCRGLVVHCETPSARAFYQHLVPEFERSPTDALHLVLLMKDIRGTLRDGDA
jgi:GNAT superfamily N-acetyltransferase